jgi:hypothetical protein
MFVHFAADAVARSCDTRFPVIVGTGLQLPPAPGIPGGREASPVGTVPSDEPPSSPEEPPPDPLLPDELVPPDEPELDVELVPDEDVEPLPEVELPLEPELLPDVDLPPELDVEPLPDEEEVPGRDPDPLSEEAHAAPSATPALTAMAVESRALFFMPPLLARRVEQSLRGHNDGQSANCCLTLAAVR